MRQSRAGLQTAAMPLWKPLPGPQTIAAESKASVIGFGGQAGGGKSDLILGLAITQHTRSLILRREGKNTQALIDRARELLGGQGRFNANYGIWRGISGNRQIQFGGCKNPGAEQTYRGRPHDLVAIDECDQLPEFMVRFICGWNRTTNPNQPSRILMSFNPPSSADGEWLLSYFGRWVDPNHPH